MTIRWGQRSTGGIVRAGHGGWYLAFGMVPGLMYVNPETGNAASYIGWNIRRGYRWCVERSR